MGKLKVSFGEPADGWIQIILQHSGSTIGISASYIYNSFYPLVEALLRLKDTSGEATVAWQCEPVEYELRFARYDDRVTLQVLLFPDPRRSVFDAPEQKLSIAGSYDEVCLPFWRALRQLQGRFSETEWEVRWQAPFPSRELDLLTNALGK